MADGAGWLPSRALQAAQVAGAAVDTGGDPDAARRLAEIAAMAQRRLALNADLVLRARKDPNVFIEACGRVEGGRWVGKQAAAHRMWHGHITAAGLSAEHSIAAVLSSVGSAKCVLEGTLVSTPQGATAIEALREGDVVLTPDPRHGTVRPALVSRLWPRVDKSIRRLRTAGGREILCATTHPLWAAGGGRLGWREAEAVDVGDSLLVLDAFGVLGWDRVVEATDLGSGPCFDIEVEAEEHAYVAGGVVAHNSTQLTRWRTVWELGNNPNLRIGIMSATTGLPEKMLAGIKSDIEHNPWVRAVFPHLRPGSRRGQRKWDELSIHVERDDDLTDPSVQLYGLSSKILGSRLDLIEIDDLLNIENTTTPYMREKVWSKVQGELFSRRPQHTRSRIWLMGHVWFEDDAIASILAMPGARTLRHGARVQRTRDGRVITSADPAWDDALPWEPLLPELVSKATLQQRYDELGWSAGHMLDNRFIRKFGVGISPEALAQALDRGYGALLVQRWNPVSTGCPVFVGVDLSTGGGADLTAIVVVALMPDGSRHVLWIESGKWEGPEIRDRLIEINRRYMPVEIGVESNAQQVYIRQFTHEAATVVPVVDHHTGSARHGLKWGLRSLAVEFSDRRWILPRWKDSNRPKGSGIDDPELHPHDPDIHLLLQGAINYSPDRHPSDHLMALWICWCRIKKYQGDYE